MNKDYKKYLNTWYGTTGLQSDYIIVTPVSKIFDTLEKQGEVILSTTGWHQRTLVKVGNKKVELLNFTQGEQFNDLLLILKNIKINKCLFVGYCAYLGDDNQIGKIISPGVTNIENNTKMVINENNKSSIMVVPKMIMTNSYYNKLRAKKIDYVDMESFFVAEWSKENNINLDIKLVVSDQPLSRPFYELTDDDWLKVYTGVGNIMQEI